MRVVGQGASPTGRAPSLAQPPHAHPHAPPSPPDTSSPPNRAQLLLIGDSGVGKSCLLLRFAVSWLQSRTARRRAARAPLARSRPRPRQLLIHPSLPPPTTGRYLHRELHQHHRRGLCESGAGRALSQALRLVPAADTRRSTHARPFSPHPRSPPQTPNPTRTPHRKSGPSSSTAR